MVLVQLSSYFTLSVLTVLPDSFEHFTTRNGYSYDFLLLEQDLSLFDTNLERTSSARVSTWEHQIKVLLEEYPQLAQLAQDTDSEQQCLSPQLSGIFSEMFHHLSVLEASYTAAVRASRSRDLKKGFEVFGDRYMDTHSSSVGDDPIVLNCITRLTVVNEKITFVLVTKNSLK